MIPQIRFPFIGGIKNVAGRTMFYVSIISFTMMLATSYEIVISKYFDISFFLYAASTIVLVITCFLFDYVIMMPSEVSFVNHQMYKHQSPIRTDLDEIKEELKVIKDKL